MDVTRFGEVRRSFTSVFWTYRRSVLMRIIGENALAVLYRYLYFRKEIRHKKTKFSINIPNSIPPRYAYFAVLNTDISGDKLFRYRDSTGKGSSAHAPKQLTEIAWLQSNQ